MPIGRGYVSAWLCSLLNSQDGLLCIDVHYVKVHNYGLASCPCMSEKHAMNTSGVHTIRSFGFGEQ